MNPHEQQVLQLLDEIIPEYARMMTEAALAEWNAACESTDENETAMEEAFNNLSLFLADKDTFAKLQAVRAFDDLSPDVKRQLDTLYWRYFENQFDEDEIRKVNGLQSQVQSVFNRYRAVLDGREVSDNELKDLLASSTDGETVQAAWLASKKIGLETAALIRELAHVRNEMARKRGFSNYQEMALAMQELDADWLFGLLDELKAKTDAPFAAVKSRLDAQLAKRFGISEDELMPWHYGDPFFQEVPALEDVDLASLLADKDVVAMSRTFYDTIGFDVRSILSRSDLYERPNKNQHAFCTQITRDGDVRILCNVRPNAYWLNTMLHELGHAIYDERVPSELPYLLRTCPDVSSTEAIAMLFDDMINDPAWLTAYAGLDAGLDAGDADHLRDGIRFQRALCKLILIRWCLVVSYFERDLYSDPDQDLNTLWWKYVTEFQSLCKPEGRDEPDYASKYHIGCTPCYYHNYILGQLIANQLHDAILRDTEADTFAHNAAAGDWLQKRYFDEGNKSTMRELVAKSTGEPLSVDAFTRAVTLA